MQTKKSYAFIVTINNPTQTLREFVDQLVELGAQSVNAQVEKGQSGTTHIQACFKFGSQRSFAAIKKQLPTAHIESCKSYFDSYKYCSKSDTRVSGPIRYGPAPIPPKRKGRTSKEFNELVLDGSIEDLVRDGTVHIGQYPKLVAASQLFKLRTASNSSLAKLENEWHYGPTGTGKSRGVTEKYPNLFRKNPNKWWDGYQGEEVVLIDDFDKTLHSCLGYYIKIWGDHYPFKAECKGSTMQIRPQKIIITSNYHPKDIWSDPQTLQPIMRRFKVHRYVEHL